jgi:hypothetical protein
MGPRRAARQDDAMTAKKDLKRRVRERQARTGESYMTALRQVRGAQEPPDRPPAFPVVELGDLTDAGAALGMRCRIGIFPGLAARVDGARALTRLRDLLLATAGDPALELMRAVVLRGETPERPLGIADVTAARTFIARVRAGLGGVSLGGRMLALQVDGETVLYTLWMVPRRDPMLIVTSPDGLAFHPLLGLLEKTP